MMGRDIMPISKTWVGGGNNRASNPKDWSPRGAPRPGDSLNMTDGTMKLAGNALAGDTLSVTGPAGSTVTIDARHSAELHLSTGGLPTVNVDVHGVLDLTAQVSGFFGQHVNFTGGSIRFIGTSTFKGSDTVFHDTLIGSGTIDVSHGSNGSGGSEHMEVNGFVGPGLTFKIEPGGPPSALQIDHPREFFGKIDLPSSGGLDSTVTLRGLHATSAALIDDFLLFFHGKAFVDAIRVNPGSGFSLEQTNQGVVMSGALPLNPPGVNIPLHVFS
jgi:hypothetical protein